MFRKTDNKKKILKIFKECVDKGLAPPKDNYQMRYKSSHQQALLVPQPTTSIQQNIKTQIDKDVDKQSTAGSSNMHGRSVHDKEGKINYLRNSETHVYCQEKDIDKQITESCQDVSEIKSNSSFGNNLSEDKQFLQQLDLLLKQSSQPLSIRSIVSQSLGMKSYIILKNQCPQWQMERDLEDNFGACYCPNAQPGQFLIGNKIISYLKVEVREEKITQFEDLYPQGTVSEQGYKTYELKQEIPCSQMSNAKLDEKIRKQFDGICKVTEKCITILNMERACDVYCTLDQINFWPEQKMLTTTQK